MAFFVPDDKISEIKHTADIVEVVSETVRLKKSGQNHMGLCPFHSEKTPSFSVNSQRAIYHCFGCGAGGDVISFVMRRDGITFPEAVKSLASRYGIQLPEEKMDPGELRMAREREDIYKVNGAAMNYFRQVLYSPNSGKEVQQYLKDRGIDGETVRDHSIGFVPDGWDNLSSFLRREGFNSEIAEKAGLVVRKKNGHFYDRFRNRVVFPIINISGQVAGFGGRVLDNSLPKYLNSPETPVYNKSRILYGYHMTKAACRESEAVHVVEGYFDLISLVANGVKNAVATLGTAITRDHIRLLSRSGVKKFVLVFDSDEAGIKAAERSIPVFQKEFINADILVLPKGYDPDSYIREHGETAFREASSKALGVLPFLTEAAITKYGLSVSGRLQVIDELTPVLRDVTEPVARSLYIRDVASRIGVDEKAVHEKIINAVGKKENKNNGVYTVQGPGNANPAPGSGTVRESRWRYMEDQVLSMMLQFPVILDECRNRGISRYFDDEMRRLVVDRIIAYTGDESGLIPYIMNNVQSAGERELVAALAIGDIPWVHENCLRLIQQFISSKSRHRDSLSDRIRKAEEKGDQALLIQLIQEKKQFSEQIKKRQAQAGKRYN